ncbi:MAG: bifunctional serine/threonine-protein kinase/formylglycine-generating enzyme family protein [bacterium]|nr:SUMF1/EgtB/PvdO family nonheme iron enzyme [Myxococcales bacterium]MCB9543090.1 SUMF1/EgtB/PvdO family nonheme iron enzyme [Myxococcales bacterium]MCB9551624.1 SUMF1/EgtB/PvdO family nonheme iron enzyme [Myxococcales bacterium]
MSSPTRTGGPLERGGDDGRPRCDPRYRLIEPIGRGGFGEVWRAVDEPLKCEQVVKVIPLVTPEELEHARQLLGCRAVETALRDQHVTPLKDRGIIGDHTLWLVMDYIDGGTFAELIAELHPTRNRMNLSTVGRDPRCVEAGWPMVAINERGQPERQSVLLLTDEVVRLLIQAGRGVGAAHAIGVVHRDLKPDNLMAAWDKTGGRLRRIAQVIDWGLALQLGANAPPVAPLPAGIIVGVPPYLAPERLDGRDPGSPRSDVYSLGAILYHILTGDPPPVGGLGPSDIPAETDVPEWWAVCVQAMAVDAAQRFANGSEFADALAAATEETRLRMNDALRHRAQALRASARALRARACAEQARFHTWDDPEKRAEAWDLEQQADELDYTAEANKARWSAGVQGSLRRLADLPVGHVMLADEQAERLEEVDLIGRPLEVRLHEERLRVLCEDIRQASAACRERPIWLRPETWDRIERAADRYARLLRGDARLTLRTDPPGRRVCFAPIRVEKRRWVEGERRELGVTPLEAVPIPQGAGVLYIEFTPGRLIAHSIRTHRTEHWDGIPPGETESVVIPLAPVVSLGAGEAYVPAGWAWIGGDPQALDPVTRARVWVDGFVMRIHPVTFAEYAEFIAALLAADSPDVARHLPRPATPEGQLEKPSIGVTIRDGIVRVDPELAEQPVCYVDWWSARAYARWYAEVTGLPYRLPSEWEYEKATRGADGRRLPWGDHMEAPWTRVINSTAETARPVDVGAPTVDVSIYGIRWLVGNRMTWCLDAWTPDGPTDGSRIGVVAPAEGELIIGRGGAFCLPARTISAATRFSDPPHRRNHLLGIRLVRAIVPVE